MNNIVVALDVGSAFVRALICERDENGVLKIIGASVKPSTGLRKGVVVNIEATLHSVREAIEDAEMMAGNQVEDCWVGIGGNHINGLNSRGVVGISQKKRDSKEREISQEDIDRVIEAAKAVVIPTDRQILKVIPQNYKVDDQKGIRDPLNMLGIRLECEVHIITCDITGGRNLIKCVNRAGFRVPDLILQTLAAGRAVITQEEMDLGVVLVDLGAGTTDVLVYVDGTPYSTYTIPAGGAQVTGDISIIANITFDNAEKIKIDAGCCWDEFLDDEEDVIVPGVGGRAPIKIPRSQILKIIKPRMEELFKMVKQHLDSLSLSRYLGGGVVLTGGGAQLHGVVELANNILRLPSRLGTPIPTKDLEGLAEEYRTPAYATVVGLALEGADNTCFSAQTNHGSRQTENKGPALIDKFKAWLKEEFF
jgi:cell division protein FtsA